ncbi:hypothetical protein EPO44_10175 [bacterium]|nr:MAG: hypothetical protein EPO44_10175 [bacterium]
MQAAFDAPFHVSRAGPEVTGGQDAKAPGLPPASGQRERILLWVLISMDVQSIREFSKCGYPLPSWGPCVDLEQTNVYLVRVPASTTLADEKLTFNEDFWLRAMWITSPSIMTNLLIRLLLPNRQYVLPLRTNASRFFFPWVFTPQEYCPAGSRVGLELEATTAAIITVRLNFKGVVRKKVS